MFKHERYLRAIMLPLQATFERKGNSFSMKLGSSAVANPALLRYIQCSANVPQVIEVSACAGVCLVVEKDCFCYLHVII